MKRSTFFFFFFLLFSCSSEDGTFEQLYTDGQIKNRLVMEGGKPVLREDFYENGTLRSKTIYKNGYLHGFIEDYHKNGNLKGVGEWRGNKLNGRYEDYYENGQLRKKTTMMDNKMNGIIETYYENGEIESSGNIKDDAWEGEVTVFPEDKKWEYAYTTAVYKKGKANGLNISYKQDGTEHSRRCFLKDKEVQLDLCG
jgi:antitoxin component YwqK of YwqJK toxin-antitoxin module